MAGTLLPVMLRGDETEHVLASLYRKRSDTRQFATGLNGYLENIFGSTDTWYLGTGISTLPPEEQLQNYHQTRCLCRWKIFSKAFPGVLIINRILKNFALLLIRTYQILLSPVLAPACRFSPTCSAYAHQSISRHGLMVGIYLALKRLLRCHPFNAGGIDPVPWKKRWNEPQHPSTILFSRMTPRYK